MNKSAPDPSGVWDTVARPLCEGICSDVAEVCGARAVTDDSSAGRFGSDVTAEGSSSKCLDERIK